MGSLSLLQGIFPTQGSNPGLLNCRWILYQLSHKGSPNNPRDITKCGGGLVPKPCSTLCNPMDCSPPGSSAHGLSQARILEWVSHSLLHGILLTQGSSPGLPHCRQMVYCVSHQGNPLASRTAEKEISVVMRQYSVSATEANQGAFSPGALAGPGPSRCPCALSSVHLACSNPPALALAVPSAS